MINNEYNYSKYIDTPEKRRKFEARFKELLKTANEFIKEAGYSENVECNERIMLNVILDYYADIDRLKQFHNVDLVRPTKMIAYTVAWIVKRKPLQFVKYSDEERDIFVNERFAAYLMINECMTADNKKYIDKKNYAQLREYSDLLLYYFKYRECNPQVIELAIESFKLGMLFE